MEQINTIKLKGNKGLYSPDMFRGGLPRGRKGKKVVEEVPQGTMTHKLGAFVGTREFTVAVVLVSDYLSTNGLTESKELIKGKDFKIWADKPDAVGNNVVEYTTIVFDFVGFVKQVGYLREPKLIRDAFDSLEMIHSSFENNSNLLDKKKRISNVSSFRGFSLKDGRAKIDISNLMLGLLIDTARSIRIDKVIRYIKMSGIVAEMCVFTEYYQGGRSKGGSFEKNVYHLADIMNEIPAVSKKVMKKQGKPYVIKLIQDALDTMTKEDEFFEKYIYDDDKEFFYNKFKKSADRSLFSCAE